MADYWKSPLKHTISLAGQRGSGEELKLLIDAGRYLVDHFQTVTEDGDLTYAMELVLLAAESGDAEDIEDATDAVENLLASRRLL